MKKMIKLKDKTKKSFMFICPACGYARSLMDIQLSHLTENHKGVLYPLCIRCNTRRSIREYEMSAL